VIISFLASHGGSSAKAIIAAINNSQLNATVGIVITNNRDSAISAWCLENDVLVRHISSKTHRGEDNADEAISTVLQNAGSQLIVCSGYMKLIGPHTLDAFPEKVVNIHPALLPKHGGKGMFGDHVHRAVLASGDTISGATVHFVTAGVDEGPIILQQEVAVTTSDTVATLRTKIQTIESPLYIAAVKKIINLWSTKAHGNL
jgi:phosphoribosylglycinamide formyltransferase 1